MHFRLRSLLILVACLTTLFGQMSSVQAQEEVTPVARVRVITSDFVLPGRLQKLAELAIGNRIKLDHIYIEAEPGNPEDWLKGIDLVILDTPRPMDMTKVEQQVGAALRTSQVPWVRIGGGPPVFGNLAPQQARPLIGYYAGGGEANARAMFAFIAAWRSGLDARAMPPPEPLPSIGFYHPEASRVFAAFDDYWQWGNPLNPFAGKDVVVVENAGKADMRIIIKNGEELTRYETSGEIGEGQGTRAGVTYRLPDGRLVYVPETGPNETDPNKP